MQKRIQMRHIKLYKFLSDPTKWPLMFNYISLSKQSCNPSFGEKEASEDWNQEALPLGLSPFFPVFCHQDIFSSWDPGCPFSLWHSSHLLSSWVPPSIHVLPCLTARLRVRVQICTQTFLETKSYELAEGGGWAFFHPMTLRPVPVWLVSLRRQLKSSCLGLIGAPQPTCPPSFHPADWLGSWQLPQWWGKLGSYLSHCFPMLRVPVFFLLSLPGSPGLPSSLNSLPPLWCLPRLFLAYQLTCTTLAFYLDSFLPFLPTAPSHTQEYIKITI